MHFAVPRGSVTILGRIICIWLESNLCRGKADGCQNAALSRGCLEIMLKSCYVCVCTLPRELLHIFNTFDLVSLAFPCTNFSFFSWERTQTWSSSFSYIGDNHGLFALCPAHLHCLRFRLFFHAFCKQKFRITNIFISLWSQRVKWIKHLNGYSDVKGWPCVINGVIFLNNLLFWKSNVNDVQCHWNFHWCYCNLHLFYNSNIV